MKRTMKRYVENGRSTPGKKVLNDTENVWNQVKSFMQEGEGRQCIAYSYNFYLGTDYTD